MNDYLMAIKNYETDEKYWFGEWYGDLKSFGIDFGRFGKFCRGISSNIEIYFLIIQTKFTRI